MKNPEKFRFLQHPADAKFQAFGQTMELAFGHAVLALASLMWNPDKISPTVKIEVAVDGKDMKQLLVSFLEELLFLLDTRYFLLHSTDRVRIGKTAQGYTLRAVFIGDNHKAGYEIFGSAKAVTYHDMLIRPGDRPMVQVVVDM